MLKITVVVIATMLLSLSVSSLALNIEPASAATDWWPMIHHDLNHTGYSTSTAPYTNDTVWITACAPSESSPVVSDGYVYIGSGDNKVYCLDAYSGDHVWDFTTGDQVSSSPAVADGKVYIGSNDNKVYCLDAASGAQIWSYTTGATVMSSSPAVADGKVYIGSWDHNVYCLDASNGAKIWNYTTGDFIRSSPAVAYGRVYVGSADSKVYCLNAANGSFIWSYAAGNFVDSSPAVVDGRIYFGSHDNKVYCLNASSGAFIWNLATGDIVDSSPAVVDGKVYVGSYDGKVYCLPQDDPTPNGVIEPYDVIWSCLTGFIGIGYSSPAVADGKVYVASHNWLVHCLDASTGAYVWNYTTGNVVNSSPAIADGKVYVGSYDGKVYAFSSRLPQPRPVGGYSAAIRFETLAPATGYLSIVTAIMISIAYVKRRKEKQ